jgi:hypothetical protein
MQRNKEKAPFCIKTGDAIAAAVSITIKHAPRLRYVE